LGLGWSLFMRAENSALRMMDLIFRTELEIERADVQDAAGGAVGKRNRHSAFTGNQAYVAHWFVAKILGVVPQEGAYAAARPVAEQCVRRPVIPRIENACLAHDCFQLLDARAVGVVYPRDH